MVRTTSFSRGNSSSSLLAPTIISLVALGAWGACNRSVRPAAGDAAGTGGDNTGEAGPEGSDNSTIDARAEDGGQPMTNPNLTPGAVPGSGWDLRFGAFLRTYDIITQTAAGSGLGVEPLTGVLSTDIQVNWSDVDVGSQPGSYDFRLIDTAISVLHNDGVRAVMIKIMAKVPPWATDVFNRYSLNCPAGPPLPNPSFCEPCSSGAGYCAKAASAAPSIPPYSQNTSYSNAVKESGVPHAGATVAYAEAYENFLHALVSQLRDVAVPNAKSTYAFEVEQHAREYFWGTQKEYAAMVQHAVPLVKSADPTAITLDGAISSGLVGCAMARDIRAQQNDTAAIDFINGYFSVHPVSLWSQIGISFPILASDSTSLEAVLDICNPSSTCATNVAPAPTCAGSTLAQAERQDALNYVQFEFNNGDPALHDASTLNPLDELHVHFSHRTTDFARVIAWLNRRMDQANAGSSPGQAVGKPIEIWEMGQRTPCFTAGVPDATQCPTSSYDATLHAENEAREITTALGEGVARFVVHTYTSPSEMQEQTDVLALGTIPTQSAAFERRPAMTAFETSYVALAGSVTLESRQLGNGITDYQFRLPSGATLDALWSDVPTTVQLAAEGDARIIDSMGAVTTGPANAIVVGSKPVFVTVNCRPSCPPGICGSDGCGGICAACPSGQRCPSFWPPQSCIPDAKCFGKMCSPDGACGACPPGQICSPAGRCN